jgi:hypothetical protein
MRYVLVRDNVNKNNTSNLITLIVVVALFVWLVLPSLKRMCNPSNKAVPKLAPKSAPKSATSESAGDSKEDFEYMTNAENSSGVEPSGVESPTYGYVPASLNESMYLLSDGANGEYSYQYNKCSPACCDTSCGPVPDNYRKEWEENKGKYVLTNMTCNSSWQNTGCLCATEKQQDFIGNRGGNN